MLEDDHKIWQETMKKIMVLIEDAAEFQKQLFKLWNEVDKKLDRKET